MVNEKEFKKYIKHNYYDRTRSSIYLAVFALFVIIIIVFFSLGNLEGRIHTFDEPVKVNNMDDAIRISSQITDGFVDTSLLLDDLDNAVKVS